MLLLGVDLGGTKTSVSLGDETGRLITARRFSTGVQGGPASWVKRVTHLAESLLTESKFHLSDVTAIGLSVPGPMSVAHGLLLAPPNLPGWIDVPIRDLCANQLRRPMFLQNDANAAALAEYRFGRDRGTSHLIYLTMSTGVGAGVIIGGQLLQGANDLGGEIGHHVLDCAGPVCPCGQRGCFEVYCGGLSVANRIRERVASGTRTTMVEQAGGEPAHIDFKIFLQAVRYGDSLALEFWTEYIERLAQAIGTLIMFYNPEVILMGTIAIHSGNFLLDPVRNAVRRFCWSCSLQACRKIEASSLGLEIGDIAALAVALDGVERAAGRLRSTQ